MHRHRTGDQPGATGLLWAGSSDLPGQAGPSRRPVDPTRVSPPHLVRCRLGPGSGPRFRDSGPLTLIVAPVRRRPLIACWTPPTSSAYRGSS